jgi:hypothetical protein
MLLDSAFISGVIDLPAVRSIGLTGKLSITPSSQYSKRLVGVTPCRGRMDGGDIVYLYLKGLIGVIVRSVIDTLTPRLQIITRPLVH